MSNNKRTIANRIARYLICEIGIGWFVLILFALFNLWIDSLEKENKINKWYDIEEEVICYYLKPHNYITDISCVRGLEWEE